MKTCDQCGTEFVPYTKRSRFCTTKCKDAWNNAHKTLTTKTCLGCGCEFHTPSPKQKYCTRSCGLKHAVVVKTCTCVDCGTVFAFTGRTKREHCDKCTPEWLSKCQMRWRAKKDPKIKLGVGSGGNQWGENNHAWKPADEHKSTRYRANWRKRCFRIWPKVCQACGSTRDIEVHHINGNPEDYADHNLVPLCFECHIHKVHSKRYTTPEEYIKATMAILPEECRNKIAELSGNPETGIRTEGC